jgi:hypothetical protein
MDIIEVLVGLVVFVGVVWFGITSSFIAMEERSAIRRQHKAGTHDYYGNKLDKNNKE